MNAFRLVALLLCGFLLLVAIVASGANNENLPDTNPETIFPGNDYAAPDIDFVAAMEAFPADTVMLSAGDIDVDWGFFYFLLHNAVGQISGGFQLEVDWDDISYTGETWAEFAKSYAIDQAMSSILFDYGISTTDMSLSEDEISDIRTRIEAELTDAGGLEQFEESLKEIGIYNLDVYEKLLLSFTLQDKLPVALYGDTLDNISDDAVISFAEENEFMQAKHILITFPDDYTELSEDDAEAAKAVTYEQIEDILVQLQERTEDEDFAGFFDEMMIEHSEDPGSFSYPNGYLFQYGDMVEPFSAACEALSPGELSGIVETSYGYHIIYRLPLEYDYTAIPDYNSGQMFSIRQLAVFNDYNTKLDQWLEMLEVVHSPELESLNIAELYAVKGSVDTD